MQLYKFTTHRTILATREFVPHPECASSILSCPAPRDWRNLGTLSRELRPNTGIFIADSKELEGKLALCVDGEASDLCGGSGFELAMPKLVLNGLDLGRTR